LYNFIKCCSDILFISIYPINNSYNQTDIITIIHLRKHRPDDTQVTLEYSREDINYEERIMMKLMLISLSILMICSPLNAQVSEHGFREEFNSLENWKPFAFPGIPRHTIYSIHKEGGKGFLVAQADNSASGIIYIKSFDIYKTPIISWKWKISNIYLIGDEKKKSGDDYPLRIYVIFKYDPAKSSVFERAQYNTLKLLYGEYPPHSSLSYIWANKKYPERILPNTYTARTQMVLLQKGSEHTGRWIEERVNAIDDYRKAFGVNPPREANIAIMSDADNTGEKATSYVAYLEVSAL
jgi:hypothetical protein